MTRPIPTTQDAIGYQITHEFSTQLPPPPHPIYNPHAPKAPAIKNPFKKLQKSPKIRIAASKHLNRLNLTPARHFTATSNSTWIGVQMTISNLTNTPDSQKIFPILRQSKLDTEGKALPNHKLPPPSLFGSLSSWISNQTPTRETRKS